jgi:chaperonin GroEL (HSP60 family)
MANQITYGDASRQAILRSVNSLANAVKATLGRAAERHPR